MRLWRRLALPIVLSGVGLAWAAAHALVHDAVSYPGGHGHAGPLEAYAAYLPTSLALCVALATALAAGLTLGKRWTGLSGPAVWLFGLVPVLGFVADTLIGVPHQGTLPGAALVELVPVVLIGLLVQIPIALTAVGIGAVILLLAERLALALASSWRLAAGAGATMGHNPVPAGRASGLLLAAPSRSRAPPAVAAS